MPEAVIVLKPRQTTAKHWKRSQLELNRKHAGGRRLNQLWAFMQEKNTKAPGFKIFCFATGQHTETKYKNDNLQII